MSELVKRLSEGRHDVEASIRPEKTADELRKRIDRGYVHIKFVGTRGGTELGVRLDPNDCDLGAADFENRRGSVHLSGTLTLDYVKVRLVADISLEDLNGQGHLEPLG